jgi:hypothetical protein
VASDYQPFTFELVPQFKMETTQSVATAFQPGDWALSMDIQVAYFQTRSNPTFSTSFIPHEGQVYQFQALPFGLGLCPTDFHNHRLSFRGYVPCSGVHAPFLSG